jgi:hypothetical protein
MSVKLSKTAMDWRPASNGGGKRMWFLMRDESVPLQDRYYYGPSGKFARYATCQAAQRAADKLNAQERAADMVLVYNESAGEMREVTRAEAAAGMMRFARSLGPGTPACGVWERKALAMARGQDWQS